MSTADPNKSTVFLTGDGFRAPAGTKLPTDKFGTPLLTPAETGPPVVPATTWDPYGGIQKGFSLTPAQMLNKHKVWNYREGVYGRTTDPLENTLKFRAVDRTPATYKTWLRGGEVVELGDGDYEYVMGDSEEFAIFWRVTDATASLWYFCDRVTLANPAAENHDGTDLAGWEFEVLCLSKLRRGGTDQVLTTP